MTKADLPQDRLSDLAEQLNTALKNRDTTNIGALAQIVERLYGEMSLMSNHQGLLTTDNSGESGQAHALLGDALAGTSKDSDYSDDELDLLASIVTAAE